MKGCRWLGWHGVVMFLSAPAHACRHVMPALDPHTSPHRQPLLCSRRPSPHAHVCVPASHPHCSVLCLACTQQLRARATPASPALCPVCRLGVESYIVREFLA